MNSSLQRGGKKIKPWESILVFVMLLGWMAVHTPRPVSFINDPDMGIQTAGAQQMAGGEFPFVQWRSTYGPSRFYASYIARWIGHRRLGAEVVLCQLAYATGYWLLFGCALMLTESRWGAVVTTIAACLLYPRLHKYFILLGPIWTLYWSLAYMRRPTWVRLTGIACGIMVTALYRMDFGLWTLLAGAAAVMMGELNWPNVQLERMRRVKLAVFVLPAVVILLSGPWLIFLLMHHSLWVFLHESTISGVHLARGLSLPFPKYRLGHAISDLSNLTALAYIGQYSIFVLAIAWIASVWGSVSRGKRKQFIVVLILAGSGLMQSMYRSDYSHLLQAICACHLLAGIVLVGSARLISRRKFQALVPAAMVVIIYGITIFAGYTNGLLELAETQGLSGWSWFYSKSARVGMNAAIQRYPDDPLVQVIGRVRKIVPRGQRVFCVPYLCSVYMLSQRLFAAGQIYLSPGYFSDSAGQMAMIQSLREQGLPPIVEQAGAMFDQRADRSVRAIVPRVFEFVEANYAVDASANMPAGYVLWRERKK